MRILVVDDHPLVATAVKAVMSGFEPDVTVDHAANARDGQAAWAHLRPARYDLILIDLKLGEDDGFELLSSLHAKDPATCVAVLSGSSRSADILRAIDLGARGFLAKRMPMDTMTQAMRLILAGGVYVPPASWSTPVTHVAKFGVEDWSPTHALSSARVGEMQLSGEDTALTPHSFDDLKLTPRQADVLEALLHGKSNKLIAKELNISIETVKDHVSAVLRLLNVRTRTQAVLVVGVIAQRSGISLADWRNSHGGATTER